MLATIEQAIDDIRQGKMLIVVDGAERENEGDLIMAAKHAHPQDIHFMARFGQGIICAPITWSRALALKLPLMAPENSSPHSPAFTVSVDLIAGNTSGTSAHDRARTAQALACSQRTAQEFYRPGHLFPLIAHKDGILTRPGHTEAAVELAHLAGLYPAGVLCEILGPQGAMATRAELMTLAQQFGLNMITICDLVDFCRQHPQRASHPPQPQHTISL